MVPLCVCACVYRFDRISSHAYAAVAAGNIMEGIDVHWILYRYMYMNTNTHYKSFGGELQPPERDGITKEKINIIATMVVVKGPEREGIMRSRSNGHRNGKITVACAIEERRMRNRPRK